MPRKHRQGSCEDDLLLTKEIKSLLISTLIWENLYKMYRIFFLSWRSRMKLSLLLHRGSDNDSRFILLDVESQSQKKLPDATAQLPFFTDEVTEMRRGEEMCPKSYNHHLTTVPIWVFNEWHHQSPKPPKLRTWNAAQFMDKHQASLDRPWQYEPMEKQFPLFLI